MIRSTRARQFVQSVTGLVYVVIAVRAMLGPEQLAQEVGFALRAPNGYSEVFAIYVGVWVATAILALVAVRRTDEPLFGDLLATFVAAQPLARALAIPFWGPPSGELLVMFALETVGALALFAVRPGARRSKD